MDPKDSIIMRKPCTLNLSIFSHLFKTNSGHVTISDVKIIVQPMIFIEATLSAQKMKICFI